MSETFFTSDLHLNHQKAIEFDKRDFSSVEEMNEYIIEEYNKVVGDNDTCYILGDVILGRAGGTTADLGYRLNGHKHLIIGNHDTEAKLELYRLGGIFESILWSDMLKVGKKHYYLSHYPVYLQNHTNNPVWCLHGHTHQLTPFSNIVQNFHVGFDTWRHPISIEEIALTIKNQNVPTEEDMGGVGFWNIS